MAQITIENLTFTYPQAGTPTINNINIEIEAGEFVVVCGKSGSGKTTFLRCLKSSIAPFGEQTGKILFEGRESTEIPQWEEAKRIGFVFQQPQHQIVMDKVWHELAFGLENFGVKSDEIRLRVAENADYFGLTDKFYESVETLSGGQKQLLNIASIMVMQPEIVILDEPSAQLDPIASRQLFATLQKINRDFGTTIIMSEHRLNDLLYMADKVLFMEHGKQKIWGNPRTVAMQLKGKDFFSAMPEAVKIYSEFEDDKKRCPLTVGEARRWIVTSEYREEIYKKYEEEKKQKVRKDGDVAISLKNIWFRYERNGRDIIKGVSLELKQGEIFGIVGGNGAGKSTLLSIIGKGLKPYRGKIKTKGFVSVLVQDVQCLFLKDTVLDELKAMNQQDKVPEVLEMMGLAKNEKMHPYDLSGGEQQRLGFAKMLMNAPDILLLDEPTKGMDDVWKSKFARILMKLRNEGKTIVVVSHDIEFLAEHSDRCGMFFYGEIISVKESRAFFKNNRFYTTEREKILKK